MLQQFAKLAFALTLAQVANATKYEFRTPYDHFEFEASGKTAVYNRKSVDISPFAESLVKLGALPTANCPALSGKPDLTISIDGSPRQIYTKIGVVTDGKACSFIDGDGIYYLPNHHEFLTGGDHDGLKLNSPLTLNRGGKVILSIQKSGAGWAPSSSADLYDWDFIERFQSSLADFAISRRVQEGLAKDKPKVALSLGGQTFELYKITSSLWALKRPGTHWLVASGDWGFWYDLGEAQLKDRQADQIAIIGDKARAKEERKTALANVESNWSPNLRVLYHRLALDVSEDPEIQETALRRLKRKPSVQTAGVMLQILERDEARADTKVIAAQILRQQNPKGPKYDLHGNKADQARALEFWRTWWKQNRSLP